MLQLFLRLQYVAIGLETLLDKLYKNADNVLILLIKFANFLQQREEELDCGSVTGVLVENWQQILGVNFALIVIGQIWTYLIVFECLYFSLKNYIRDLSVKWYIHQWFQYVHFLNEDHVFRLELQFVFVNFSQKQRHRPASYHSHW